MPVRIYALAKELSLDSKELVDICRKAGITGKGSALASLTDEEADKVKSFLGGGDKPKSLGKKKQPEPVPERMAAPIRPSKPVVLDKPKPIPKIKVAAKDKAAPDLAPEVVEPETVVPEAPPTIAAEATETPAAPETPPTVPEVEDDRPAQQGPATYSRNDYIAPGQAGKIRVLDVGSRGPAAKGKPGALGDASASPKAPKKRAAVIKLARAPQVKQPVPQPKKDEPKAQKPDIRLPKDVISGHSAGKSAPLEDLKKATEEPAKKPHDKRKKRSASDVAPQLDETPLTGRGGSKRRRGGGDGPDSSGDGLAGMASARADRKKASKSGAARSKNRGGSPRFEFERERGRPGRRPRTLTRRRGVNTAAPRKENVILEMPCTIRSFSEAAGIGAGQVLKTLMTLGVSSLNINAEIDREMAELAAADLGVEIEFREASSLEETLVEQVEAVEDAPEDLQPRPPIVTFLGHVDHGKTSLLDYIIGTNVVSGEAGGITQHIRAYQIKKGTRKIAFVDTPGHEAFTEMRARGANVTDIAVLVVAADDGLMPQTEEAISHARAAEVPIIVALNKMDLPGANPERVLQQLAAQNLLPSEWGGDVEVIRTSATTGDGMDDLLETILLTADIHEYTANPDRNAVGVCLEAEQEPGRGVIAKMIVQTGTMNVGDIVVCGESHGRIKAMYDTLRPRKKLKSAGPSMPVNITGLDTAPGAGERFYVMDDISKAREIAAQRANRTRKQSLSGFTTRVSFEEFQRRLAEGSLVNAEDVVHLNLIVRADVRGSIEAIEKELTKLDHPEVQIKILHKAVGAISAADVTLAHASQAVIVGFNVIPDEAARALADERQVEIRRYDIIYKMTDDIRALLEGRLKPEERMVELGHALVKRVFPISRVGAVAGCYVVRGMLQRNCRIRVNRDGRTIGDYELDSLRREKDDVKEVPRGMECGVKLTGFNDIKQDDVLEAYRIEEVARSL